MFLISVIFSCNKSAKENRTQNIVNSENTIDQEVDRSSSIERGASDKLKELSYDELISYINSLKDLDSEDKDIILQDVKQNYSPKEKVSYILEKNSEGHYTDICTVRSSMKSSYTDTDSQGYQSPKANSSTFSNPNYTATQQQNEYDNIDSPYGQTTPTYAQVSFPAPPALPARSSIRAVTNNQPIYPSTELSQVEEADDPMANFLQNYQQREEPQERSSSRRENIVRRLRFWRKRNSDQEQPRRLKRPAGKKKLTKDDITFLGDGQGGSSIN